jgi:hypothetical protein
MPLSPPDILDNIQSRLGEGTPPAQVIAELLPRTSAEAVSWARRLPGWDEERDRYPGQMVALARVISRQALRAFRLRLTDEGRVLDKPIEGALWQRPEPADRFRLTVSGEEGCVAYTPFFVASGEDKSVLEFSTVRTIRSNRLP